MLKNITYYKNSTEVAGEYYLTNKVIQNLQIIQLCVASNEFSIFLYKTVIRSSYTSIQTK